MIVQVVAPDPAWAAMFEDEALRLRTALADVDVEVRHIGSTAIRGIHAKPIIDMLMIVRDLAGLDNRVDAVRMLGYEAMGEFGIPGRRYFRRNSPQGIRTHHVHSFERGSAGARRHLAFCAYMNAHAEIAQEYSLLKRRLANAFPNDIQAYMDGKDPFIKKHEALALAWFSDNP